jgi:trk system potassium uptake protein TrkH
MFFLEKLKERYSLIFGYSGIILMGVSFILLTPLIILPFYKNEIYQVKFFFIPFVLTFILGWLLKRLKHSSEVTLTLTEGGLIVVITWILTVIFSALPFVFSGQLDFSQAIFESVSGWTTTGLSVVDVTETSNLFLFWRSIMQFFGGAGLAVVMLSSIIGPYGLGLYNAEGRSDKLLPHVKRSTKMIMVIYVSYITVGAILYVVFGMSVFDAINHSIAAVSTGGFSTQSNSIGTYNNISIELVTIVLMLLGTINFASHFVLIKRDFKQFFKTGEIKFMFVLISITVPIVAFVSLNSFYGSLSQTFRYSTFELVSALTTTGFNLVSYNDWPNFAFFIMIILMLIGGGTGSTAGGIKQYRIFLVLKSIYWEIRKFLQPKRVVNENYIMKPDEKFYVDQEHIVSVYNFIAIYMFFYMIGVLIMTAHGYSLRNALFEYASSIGTVGLSIGITSPDTPRLVMWSQTIGMFIGRLEIFVIFFAMIKFVKDLKFYFKNKKFKNN